MLKWENTVHLLWRLCILLLSPNFAIFLRWDQFVIDSRLEYLDVFLSFSFKQITNKRAVLENAFILLCYLSCFKMRFRKFFDQSIKASMWLPSRPWGSGIYNATCFISRWNPARSHNLSFLFSAPAISLFSALFFSGAFLLLLFRSFCVSNQRTQHGRFHMNDKQEHSLLPWCLYVCYMPDP